jgi:hypothetical protein
MSDNGGGRYIDDGMISPYTSGDDRTVSSSSSSSGTPPPRTRSRGLPTPPRTDPRVRTRNIANARVRARLEEVLPLMYTINVLYQESRASSNVVNQALINQIRILSAEERRISQLITQYAHTEPASRSRSRSGSRSRTSTRVITRNRAVSGTIASHMEYMRSLRDRINSMSASVILHNQRMTLISRAAREFERITGVRYNTDIARNFSRQINQYGRYLLQTVRRTRQNSRSTRNN